MFLEGPWADQAVNEWRKSRKYNIFRKSRKSKKIRKSRKNTKSRKRVKIYLYWSKWLQMAPQLEMDISAETVSPIPSKFSQKQLNGQNNLSTLWCLVSRMRDFCMTGYIISFRNAWQNHEYQVRKDLKRWIICHFFLTLPYSNLLLKSADCFIYFLCIQWTTRGHLAATTSWRSLKATIARWSIFVNCMVRK